MKKKLIVIVIIIYIASIYGAFRATEWNYTNRWKHISPDAFDVVIMLIPIINTIFAIDWILKEYNIYNIPDRL